MLRSPVFFVTCYLRVFFIYIKYIEKHVNNMLQKILDSEKELGQINFGRLKK